MSATDHTILDVDAANALRKRLSAPPKLSLPENVRSAVRAGSRDYIRRLVKTVAGPGKLSVDEFFYYRLYDPVLPVSAITRFVGKRTQLRLHIACNDWQWHAACNDKLLCSTILTGAGLAIPETMAVYSEEGQFGIYRPLRNQAELASFIANAASYPLFCKPVDGMYSVGVFRVDSASDEAVILGNGERRSAEEIARFMSSLSPKGYLLQKALEPAAAIVPFVGSALASIRFLVLLTDQGAVVESAAMKIPARNQVADNYWRAGNMLGAIDLETGRLMRVVTGTGAELKAIEPLFPDGRPLIGMAVPDFDAARSLCLRAASHFSGARTQSWDVALTANGPVLLEVNFGGDLNLHQLAHNRGILSDSFCGYLRACGYKGRLP